MGGECGGQCLEQFSDPTRKGYRQWWAGDELQSGALGVRFVVNEILGSAAE